MLQLLLSLSLVFGQNVDAILGGAGWASFGIAGLILAWLFLKHLPDKDSLIERLIEKSDTKVVHIAGAFDVEQAASRKASLDSKTIDKEIREKEYESILTLQNTLVEVFKQEQESVRVLYREELRKEREECTKTRELFHTVVDEILKRNEAQMMRFAEAINKDRPPSKRST